MNSKLAFFLLFLVTTSCSTNPLVWEAMAGSMVSEEKPIAAKEACDYDRKHAEWAVNEEEYRELSNISTAYFGNNHLNEDLEHKISDLNKVIGEIENEIFECMRQQGLVQR